MGRHFDERVAREIIGLEGPLPDDRLWRFGTSAEADLVVLCHVRVFWSAAKLQAMASLLEGVWRERAERLTEIKARAISPGLLYEPGDYSRAALAAVELALRLKEIEAQSATAIEDHQ